MSEHDCEKYRKFVNKKLSEIVEIIANISVGDFSHRLNTNKLEDDEFSDLFCGIDLMMDNLIEARKEIQEQKQLDNTRVELWKIGLDDLSSEKRIIKKIFQLIGSALDLSLAVYIIIDKDNHILKFETDWHAPGIKIEHQPDIKINDNYSLFGTENMVFNSGSPSFEDNTINEIISSRNIKSFIALPYGGINYPEGCFLFAECRRERWWEKREINLIKEITKILSARCSKKLAENSVQFLNQRLEKQVIKRTAELASEKELLSLTLKNITDGVITINSDNEIILINEKAKELTGWYENEAIGKDIEEVFNSRDIMLYKLIKKSDPINLIKPPKDPEFHTYITSKSGTKHKISCSWVNSVGNTINTVIVFRDIGEQEKLEKESLKAHKLESIALLAGGIAHDFNNILTGIIGNLQLAIMEDNINENTILRLDEAKDAAFRASKLTKRLLTFSKGGNPVKEITVINELLDETMRFSLSGSNITYSLSIPKDLWLVNIDKGQIYQVISNLSINAKHAMENGGKINVNAENFTCVNNNSKSDIFSPPLEPGPYIKITFKDQGTGIDSQNIQKIFDPYFTTKSTGSGLGLATSYSIIKKHKGHISVESEPGHGAVFTIFLPAEKENVSLKHVKSKKINHGCGRILLMDDDHIVRNTVKSLLESIGYEINCVSNGNAAIELYKNALKQKNPYILVIIDLSIPGGMGGEETIKWIRKMDSNAKAIVFSAYSNSPIISDYKKFGFNGIITKPFKIEDFSDVITKIISEKSIKK